jgi:hypothetical protein
MRLAVSVFALAAPFSGCGDDDQGSGVTLTGNTVCERVASLAAAKGCAAPTCTIDVACTDVVNAWLDCIARDLTQCLCEAGDQSLNCEGSFKPNEGPALCISEHTASSACTDG